MLSNKTNKGSTLSIHWQFLPMLAVLGLVACGDYMDPPNMDVPLPQTWAIQAEAQDQPAKLNRDWWKAANDASLNQLMDTIEKQNLSIEQARFRLQAARTDIGGNHYLPTLGLNQSINLEPVATFQQRTTPGGVPSNAVVNSKFGGYHKIGLDAQWEIPLFGSYEAAEGLSQANIEYAAADIDAVRASVYAEAVTDYIQLRAAQQRLTTLKQMQTSQKRITTMYAIRVNAGFAEREELTHHQQRLLTINAELAAAQSGVTEYLQRIAKLQGSAIVDKTLEPVGPLVLFPPQHFSDTPADVVRNRPDIRKAEKAVLAAGDELKLAKNDRYPKLNLNGELFQFTNLISRPIPYTTPGGSLAEGITLPLFDWGRLRAAAEAKDAKLAEAANIYRETVIGAVTESQQMLAAYQAATAQRIAAIESYRHAETLAKQAAVLNSQGLTNKIALENAAIIKQHAAIDKMSALSNESISLTNLTKALGGGLAEKTGAERAKKDQ